jgi:hypothetical protein
MAARLLSTVLAIALVTSSVGIFSTAFLTNAVAASTNSSTLHVAILQPVRNANVTLEPLTISGWASSASSVPIKSVDVRIDNHHYIHASISLSGAAYSWSLAGQNITTTGHHTIVARATDLHGTRAYAIDRINVAQSAAVVPPPSPPIQAPISTQTGTTVDSAAYPSVVITSPAGNSAVNASVLSVTGTALEHGNGSIQKVEVQLNGSAYQIASPVNAGDWSSWQLPLNMTLQPVGHYVLQARVTDSTGKQNWTKTQFDYSLYDSFASPYTLTPSFNSPNGKWFGVWNGGGSFGVAQYEGKNVFYEQASPVTSPADSQSSLALSTQQFKNFNLSLDVNTNKQTRLNSPPNHWEVAWVIWHWNDNTHFNYFVVKTNGAETGKYDGGVNPVDQKILYSNDQPTAQIGKWMHWDITVNGKYVVVKVDGAEVFQFSDESSFSDGQIGLYCEDSVANFDDVYAQELTTSGT